MRDASYTCAMARWIVSPYSTEDSRPGVVRSIALFRPLGFVCALAAHAAVAAPPYLTGVVDDADSQVIEMPRLPGMWQRQVAWLAPEGSTVAPGDLVVRLDPGELIAQEEAAQTDLEQRRLQAERRLAETMLAILDAQTAVIEAESAVRLAQIDAEVHNVDDRERLVGAAGRHAELIDDRPVLVLATAMSVLPSGGRGAAPATRSRHIAGRPRDDDTGSSEGSHPARRTPCDFTLTS